MIVGDRNPSTVNIAIVHILGLVLTKGRLILRTFVPQFQTTFVKRPFPQCQTTFVVAMVSVYVVEGRSATVGAFRDTSY